MKKPLLLLLALAMPWPAAATDLTVVYKISGASKGERTQYYSDNYQLTVDKGLKQDTLVDIKQDITYQIDHRSKTIQVMKMSDIAGMMGQVGQMNEQAASMKLKGGKTLGENQQDNLNKALGDPSAAQLEKLGPQQVAGRTCEAYRVHRRGSYLDMTEEVCIDASLKPPGQLSASQQQMAASAQAMMGGAFGGMTSAAQSELHAMPGLTLKRKITTNRVENNEEATSIKEGPIDVALFQLPQGYQQIDQAALYQQQMQDAQRMMQRYQK